ncbi:MAG: serine hydrolase [Hyphomonadaceae bacterium]
MADRFAAALGVAEAAKSTALIVEQGGERLLERYWTLAEPSQHFELLGGDTLADGRTCEDVASVQKSVIAFLAGIAITEGKMALDAPVSDYIGVGWSKAPADREAAITIRHAMAMTTGLSTALEYEEPAGARWEYNTNAYATVTRALVQATGRELNDLTKAWLTDPAEMHETEWRRRTWHQAEYDANAVGLFTTARDLTRFGQVVLAGGRWGDRVLLDNPAYVKAMLSPSQTRNPGYGLLWWTEPPPSAPPDLVAARGTLHRYLFVSPSRELVVTRLGDEPPQGHGLREDLFAALMPAL